MECVLTPASGQDRAKCSPGAERGLGLAAGGVGRSVPGGHFALSCPSAVASTALPYHTRPAPRSAKAEAAPAVEGTAVAGPGVSGGRVRAVGLLSFFDCFVPGGRVENGLFSLRLGLVQILLHQKSGCLAMGHTLRDFR